MIVTKEIEITGNSKTLQYYRNKGYNINWGDKIKINIEDLIKTSTIKLDCICDICNSLNNIKYFNYIGNITRNNLYRCNECSKSIRVNKIKDIFNDDAKKNKIISKSKTTCLNKYGFDSPMKIDMFKLSSKQSSLDKYGVDNPMKNVEVKEKLKSSLLLKYGVDHYSKTDMFKIKYKSACLLKYGCENTFQSPTIKQKIKEILLEKYGVDNPTKNIQIFEKAQRHSYRIHKHEDIEISYQGTYELDFINYCINNNIKFEKGPTIDYNMNDIHRKYHSDFYVPQYNLICEVKSSWTYERDLEENLMKMSFSKKIGYNFLFIMNKDYSVLEKYLAGQ